MALDIKEKEKKSGALHKKICSMQDNFDYNFVKVLASFSYVVHSLGHL